MKENGILAKAVKLISGIKLDVAKAKFSKSDFAVLQVAMMVSALDGDVREDELAAFGKLAKKCRGYSPDSAKAALDAGLHAAGYLALQAKRLKEKDLIGEFVREAVKALPENLVIGCAEDVRRTFVMWIAMGMSDGDYSPIERKAIAALQRKVAEIMGDRDDKEASLWREISPAHAVVYADGKRAFARREAPSGDFMVKAEALLGKLKREDAAPAALKELKSLILNG